MTQPIFDLNAMKAAVVKCHQNIEMFDAEIKVQRDTIIEYQMIIAKLEASNGDNPSQARP